PPTPRWIHPIGYLSGFPFPLPRRHMSWRNLQTVLSLPCILLQPLSFRIPGSVFPIPPTPAVFDQSVTDVAPIEQTHIGKSAPVRVLTQRLARTRDSFSREKGDARERQWDLRVSS